MPFRYIILLIVSDINEGHITNYDTCGRESEEGFLLRQMPITITGRVRHSHVMLKCFFFREFLLQFSRIRNSSNYRVSCILSELSINYCLCFFCYISTLSEGRTTHFFSLPESRNEHTFLFHLDNNKKKERKKKTICSK